MIEVATFRRQVAAGEEVVQDGVPAPDPTTPEGEQLIHRDNTFGTPEEDAFRRDFTINALFYDIATFSIIDYVGGLDDLRAGIVRSIGDPDVRLREDPVRMIRAIALAARLDFTIEPTLLDAIRTHRHEIAKSSPPRLLEEYYKILRAGSAEKAFRRLADVGLLEPISPSCTAAPAIRCGGRSPPSMHTGASSSRRPTRCSNAILLGSLLVPLGISLHPRMPPPARVGQDAPERLRIASRDQYASAVTRRPAPRHPPGPRLGDLPLARRDVERLRQILGLQRRLRDSTASPRAQRALAHRSIFREALTWMEIHGGSPEWSSTGWRVIAESGAPEPGSEDTGDETQPPW